MRRKKGQCTCHLGSPQRHPIPFCIVGPDDPSMQSIFPERGPAEVNAIISVLDLPARLCSVVHLVLRTHLQQLLGPDQHSDKPCSPSLLLWQLSFLQQLSLPVLQATALQSCPTANMRSHPRAFAPTSSLTVHPFPTSSSETLTVSSVISSLVGTMPPTTLRTSFTLTSGKYHFP
jgi:hypothetical protein